MRLLSALSGAERDHGASSRHRPVEGEQVTMGFRRQSFTWSSAHIPGTTIQNWEGQTDAADKLFRRGMGVEQFEEAVAADGLASLPSWVDFELLGEGCSFFIQMWPFILTNFFWAMLGGFGSESASAVLLQSRYWAGQGDMGREDTWQRLRETACWLFDVAGHGKDGFTPGGPSWKACLHVRYLHCRTRASIWSSGAWGAEKTERYGQPINQGQLVGTLLGSSALLLQGMEEMAGASLPQRSKEAFVHLWRVIGFLFGIDEGLNPNRSHKEAVVAMESVFHHGVPAFPEKSLTGSLTQHICESVAYGVRQESGLPIDAGAIAVPAWYFLGREYGTAVGLPKPTWAAWLVGLGRMYALKSFLLLYHVPGVPQILESVMFRLFASLVLGIRQKQPRCRFGADAVRSVDQALAAKATQCPLGFGRGSSSAQLDTCMCIPKSEDMANAMAKMMPTIL